MMPPSLSQFAMEADMPAAAQAFEQCDISPIDRPSLAAFKDLGLSDRQVASYFRVPQDDVAMLRAAYGIADQPRPAIGEPPRRRRFPWRRRS
jgi:hypothetical protein